ncbi:hypothetical protein [Modestobacter altitudinis]|uniref:hypothetical protein n=1 Tax=Modestobacter altitudinis TaxID=2213158 RepID=UPI00110CD9B4|nr:hypothetical protein [Modestobacter altitudinis]
MTTTRAEHRTGDRRTLLTPDPFVVTGALVALGCTFVGQFVDTPWRPGSPDWGFDFADGGGLGALAVLLAFVLVAAVVVSLVTAAARAAGPAAAGRRALWLAAIGVLSLGVFWTGVPAVVAGGAAGLATSARRSGGRSMAAGIAVVLAVLTVAGAVYLAVAG